MTEWKSVCCIDDIMPYSGVATLIQNEQVAIFRAGSDTEVFAISNYDPFSDAYVLSRGLVGDRKGTLKVASPIYKHNFDLKTGQCLDDPEVKLPTFPVRVVDGLVQVGVL
ncbi:MAG TPA: nitrite reductase small subunit NirD [Phototrophicaceae bacterium]|nr:nitrite reductase small subunit NirD [Phototrophicaceae bacterium]